MDVKLFAVAGVFVLLAAVCAIVLLRTGAASEMAAEGVIVARTFKPASTYTQVPVGIDRGMRTPTSIPIAESYVFEIRVDGLDQSVFLGVNAVASRSFEVGQRVRISYKRRGIPFASKKYLGLGMEAVSASAARPQPRAP